VIGSIGWSELIQKPQALLRKRERATISFPAPGNFLARGALPRFQLTRKPQLFGRVNRVTAENLVHQNTFVLVCFAQKSK
jgi:hypothetical protein